ncbi:hypothetical protein GQ43DRAFT_460691 [Delitschia confertaspora ATCC 74209]|uniref:Uncharacterized protein n=1 Tax=Delitschia confertaspora ATCC 74209 TaxID=1513339 RepID=A0A9P4JS43_9PLEO|nr:hypothetical protein GQ43DRAFT_460691 [Delitschia confertaspora ATCC 74209]
MASDHLERAPILAHQAPTGFLDAVTQWARGRRARTLFLSVVFVVLASGVILRASPESISYPSFSKYNLPSWSSYVPDIHTFASSILRPSDTTLELENGTLSITPSHLNKETPNFHLILSAQEDTPGFCQAVLSAMLMNYPPVTVVGFQDESKSQEEIERKKMEEILGYLTNTKLVNDEDLVLIADGEKVWFQLPSDVMIKQYQGVLADANKRLLDRYGYEKGTKQQTFNQTVVFGAEKVCRGGLVACSFMPESMLPRNIYGIGTGKEAETTPAKHLNAGTIMGPAKDLRVLFEAAISRVKEGTTSASDAQTVFATMFAEQHMARETTRRTAANSSFKIWLDAQLGRTPLAQTANLPLQRGRTYEFSIGLDYAHILFQPCNLTAAGELKLIAHNSSIDLSTYHHPHTPTPPLALPEALETATPPFYTPDLSETAHRPDGNPTYIEALELKEGLDELPPADTPWTDIKLVMNTYTGAVPALLHISPRTDSNLTFPLLWFHPHARALLRRNLRTVQSATGFHAAAVGGDRFWDERGGRGGVWTAREGSWYAWGDEDGVCGDSQNMEEVFGDGRGRWRAERLGRRAVVGEEGKGDEGLEVGAEGGQKAMDTEFEVEVELEAERKGLQTELEVEVGDKGLEIELEANHSGPKAEARLVKRDGGNGGGG